MRRAFALATVVGLSFPGAALAVDSELTLTVEPGVASYGATVHFSGRLSPADAGVPVGVYVRNGDEWRLVLSGETGRDGSYRLASRVRRPASYLALAQIDGEQDPVASSEVGLRIRPLLQARLVGARLVGARLAVAGRLLPARAGTLVVRIGGRPHRVRVSRSGRFAASLASRGSRLRVGLVLRPASGYTRVRRSVRARLRAPALALGSTGVAVRALERRLADLRYALQRVDGSYGSDTLEAVLAFQKVHGFARSGRVGSSFWRALSRASIPRARVARGDHIEVVKARQVLFEVRRGRVVQVVHVSTGATGNTPVGTWHVYRRWMGWHGVLWYPLYFLRGFAIHGYPSVPAYPASHGCVRVPMWFAPGLQSRWGLGTTVLVFP